MCQNKQFSHKKHRCNKLVMYHFLGRRLCCNSAFSCGLWIKTDIYLRSSWPVLNSYSDISIRYAAFLGTKINKSNAQSVKKNRNVEDFTYFFRYHICNEYNISNFNGIKYNVTDRVKIFLDNIMYGCLRLFHNHNRVDHIEELQFN